ncbi:endonuclease/exonuclease/phosphatase family protein [Chloroflexi bacterium TSY]|nr:endonuclease/exonuclease/phosphatase family protein [Chloroflexi bacterium TSY]
MFRVISYNIRYNNPKDGANAWPHRKERVTTLLENHEPDLIGRQEVQKNQLEDLIPKLPDFGWVGVGRDDGKTQGEYAAIFYRHRRFDLMDSGTIWLSETPHVVGSVGWDASMARVATWAKFVDVQHGNRFLHVNTHFDHRGQLAQVESARLLHTFLAEQEESLPAIITGDFNCIETSQPYQALTDPDHHAPPLLDARYVTQAPHEGPHETFNGTFTDPLHAKIDYIFVWLAHEEEMDQRQNPLIQVHRHAILTDNRAGWYPSDHLPVLADILIA